MTIPSKVIGYQKGDLVELLPLIHEGYLVLHNPSGTEFAWENIYEILYSYQKDIVHVRQAYDRDIEFEVPVIWLNRIVYYEP